MFKIGIRARLTVSIISAVVVITMILVGYFSIHNRKSDKQSAFELIDNTSDKIASEIVGRLNIDLGRTRALAASFEAYDIKNEADVESNIMPILTKAMIDNPNYLAFWISFELNSIDPDYKDKPGRKTWLADRLNGTLAERTEYRGVFNIPESPQYLEIKKTKFEALIDPYFYKIMNQGIQVDSILEATIGVPVMSKGKVIGLAGIDFTMEEFSQIIRNNQSRSGFKTILISNNGTVVASSGKDIVGSSIADEEHFGAETGRILDSIKTGGIIGESWTNPELGDYYFRISPVRIGTSDKAWAICMIAPHKEILKNANLVFLYSLLLGLAGMIMMAIVVYIISIPLIKPIMVTTRVLDTLSQGIVDDVVHLEAHDHHELGLMAGSVNRIQQRFKAIAGFATDIGRGKLDTVYPFDTEKDMLGQALEQMQTDLTKLHNDTERKDWLKSGIAGLNDAFRGCTDLNLLAEICIRYIANYLQAPVGALYFADESSKMLHLGSGYALTKGKKSNPNVYFGEGLVGQCAKEQKLITLGNIPDEQLQVHSSTVNLPPKEILVFPCLFNNQVLAVIEIGRLFPFTADEKEFLESISGNIAITVQTVKAQDEMSVLLAKTLEQKEELQVQQEELRVTNQELERNAQLLEEQSEKINEKNRALEVATLEIERKAKDLELASRYKSEFLANMSHELRTPLNSMLILSQSLADNSSGRLSPEEIESAQIIYKSGNDLHNLINEILDLSKIEAGKMTINPDVTEVRLIADNIRSLYRPAAAEKGLNWLVKVEPDCPFSIYTDQQRTEQIIKNLVSNALKFTSRGEVSVIFSRTQEGIAYTNPLLSKQANLAISVSDTGIGISSDKQMAIFEAFQQADGSTSRKFGGTGLGLSISRELSKLLGGEIHLSSTPGQGSVFTLILPGGTGKSVIEPGNSKSEPMNPLPVQPLETGTTTDDRQIPIRSSIAFLPDDRDEVTPETEHILVIEDDPVFAKILYKECQNQHFKCILAGDGESGLELAAQYLPAAIILDIKLPGIDGWKVLDQIKRDPKIRHIPVHMMSSLDETIEAYQKGAIGYLKKPVTAQSLSGAFEKIEHFLEKKMKHLLIVEDNENLRKTMHQLLKGADILITEVPSALECLETLRKQVFDCIILDLGLPDKNGLDLIKDIRELNLDPTPPIIIYTGQDLSREQNEELNKYTKSIIIKGVRSEERLLDEASLFLHRMVQNLPHQQQVILRKLYEKEDTFDGKKVLLVDDDMRNIFALSKVFEEKGIKVLKAENGLKALKIIQENTDVDAVLMDIMMPEMDGYEAIREIRKIGRFKNTPIIALTAKAMKEDRQKCLDAGASDYISKPIEMAKLLSLLRVWLKK